MSPTPTEKAGHTIVATRNALESTRADHVLTFDLRLPTWPFFALAWIGDLSAVILIALRTYRLIFHPELLSKPDAVRPVE